MPATTPEQLHVLFDDAVNAHDLDALLDLYEPDSLAVDLDGNTLHGTTAIRQFLADFFAVAQSIVTTTGKVITVDGIALLSGHWRAHIHT
ncbi:MAG: nuclear transport factor 2 family protein, partial [Mycobacterium sp.]|nr:nuclear transport factor 2 family protein [Mycobacterium sp.]